MRIALPSVRDIIKPRVRKSTKDAVIEECQNLMTDAQEALNDRHSDWGTYHEYYLGTQALNKDVDSEVEGAKDLKIVNEVMPTVEAIIPVIRDAAPIWYAIYEGTGEIGLDLAPDVTAYLQAFWHHSRFDRTLEQISRNAVILGTGVCKVYWDTERGRLRDSEQENWQEDEEDRKYTEREGDVAIDWQDPYLIFPDPAARDLQDARYLGLKVEVTLEALHRQFPKLDDDEVEHLSGMNTGQRLLTDEYVRAESDLCEVWEVYHDFGKYLTIYTGSQVLWHGPNPTPNERYPVVMFTDRRMGGEMWGRSLIADLMSLQDDVNVVYYMFRQHLRNAVPQRITTDGSITQEVTNRYGELIKIQAKRGDKPMYQWTQPPPIPAEFFAILDREDRKFDTISGIHEVTQGIRPKGITSGIALSTLHEATQGRLRMLMSSLSLSIEDVGQLVLEYMQQNYLEERRISYFGADQPETATMPWGALSEPMNMKPREYRVIVQSRGDLPLNPAALADLGIQLAQIGAIDAQELLNVLGWPNRDEVGARMQDMQRQQGLAQMQGALGAQGAQGMQGGQMGAV